MVDGISGGSSALQAFAAAPGAGGQGAEIKALNQMKIEGINMSTLIDSAGSPGPHVGQNINTVA
jgi:hypothetical protein